MINYSDKVLKTCIERVRNGESNLNVFDLMYETNLAYPQLKEVLDKLVSEKELAVIDIKTYKFTGDINRKFEKPEARNFLTGKLLEDKRDYLEQRRRELIARMHAEARAKAESADNEADEDALFTADDVFDKKFAEYEKYVKENLGVGDDLKDSEKGDDGLDGCEVEPENVQLKKLVEYLKGCIRRGRENKPFEKIPEHPSWDDEDEFMQFCGERLMSLVTSDKKTGRQGAIKKAKALLDNAMEINNAMITEVCECIVYGLQNMSDYYYLKIRNGIL